ncbi:MAG: signal recognition particle-docking protein FtsY [Clostridia bacterium]|nr:signal recognition particle-docking protein FtsY [Clostridia bacterium]
MASRWPTTARRGSSPSGWRRPWLPWSAPGRGCHVAEGSWLQRLKAGLARTRNQLAGRLWAITGGRTLDDDFFEELEAALLQADVGVEATVSLVEELRRQVQTGQVRDAAAAMAALRDAVAARLAAPAAGPTEGAGAAAARRTVAGLHLAEVPPSVVLFVGVNGAGKTTTVGKLACALRREGLRVVLAAADTFRAAAGEQLAVWAERAGADLVRHGSGADPAAVVFDAIQAARARRADAVLVDTAGRLHTKANLMDELRKVCRVAAREVAGAPHEVLLVLDAGVGQNALQQARLFREAAGVTGVVLTKLDGTARGGVAVAVAGLGLPIRFVGVGEGIDDLRPFDPVAFSEALFEPERSGG